MAILASLVSSAATQKGGGETDSAPSVSPGLDPGRYAFELAFNRARREEEAAERQRLFEEYQRQFNRKAGQDDRTQNMSAIGMLGEQRQNAEANARIRTFRQMLTGMGGSNGNG